MFFFSILYKHLCKYIIKYKLLFCFFCISFIYFYSYFFKIRFRIAHLSWSLLPKPFFPALVRTWLSLNLIISVSLNGATAYQLNKIPFAPSGEGRWMVWMNSVGMQPGVYIWASGGVKVGVPMGPVMWPLPLGPAARGRDGAHG